MMCEAADRLIVTPTVRAFRERNVARREKGVLE
jgi:hypothetical protein